MFKTKRVYAWLLADPVRFQQPVRFELKGYTWAPLTPDVFLACADMPSAAAAQLCASVPAALPVHSPAFAPEI